ncbi:hypothetical protein AVEN_33282-1 [Araneus ventricosus]|uniref:DUF4817 domain-containing protein n=1 Tax=Araneus ventricosus TaxID=182803 RepID=A0A4Y2PFN9_ARAVE|nr:hypothetical protein AVEN_33282-1 [Araneus ventricosus]
MGSRGPRGGSCLPNPPCTQSNWCNNLGYRYRGCRRRYVMYRERFPEGPFRTNETILNVVKLLRKTGHVTIQSLSGRPCKVGRQVQLGDVLAFALAHPQSSTRGMSEKCGLSRSRISKLLNEEAAHLYRLRPEQAPVAGYAARRHDVRKFIMNQLELQPTFLKDIIWTDEACFSRNEMYKRQNTHY